MQIQKRQFLRFLKENAVKNIQIKRYSWATVYLYDAIKFLDDIIEDISKNNTQLANQLISQMKIALHKNLSFCYLKLRNYQQCIKQCDKVLKYEPQNEKILYRTGIAHIHTKKFLQSKKYLQTAFLLNPNQKQVSRALQVMKNNIVIEKKQKFDIKQKNQTSTIMKFIKFCLFWPFYVVHFCFVILFRKNQ